MLTIILGWCNISSSHFQFYVKQYCPFMESGHGKAVQGGLSTRLVGTDHCAFNSTQKAFGIDNFRKIPYGVNDNYELLWFLRMHLVQDTMVVITSTEWYTFTLKAWIMIFNIYPRKGAILVGSDADIIIFNPNSSFEISATSHHSRLDTNVFEGRRGKALNRDAAYGKVEVKIAGGRIVWEKGQLKVALGDGKYVEMQPFSYLFGGIDKADAKYLSSLRAPVK
ncbi:hypothetical protein CsSME_00035566 [Camellia sinensis var. sinensis]